MATDKKKLRKSLKDDYEKPTKEEYAVAKYMRFNAPSKEGKFNGNNVQYFIGSKVVDFLLESQWSSKKAKSNPLFTNRSSCVGYCSRLLKKGFFCRVLKPEKKEKNEKKRELEKSSGKDDSAGVTKKGKSKKEKESVKSKKNEEEVEQTKQIEQQTCEEKSSEQNKDDSSNDEKKKKKKIPRLNWLEDQRFIDGVDLYVWIYDPVPMKTFVIGLLLVIGVIAVCLFPLWPPEIKIGIYYLSCAAVGFIVVILSLCVIRLILFVIIWLSTMGKISFWLLPNLTEDVGFIDSFRPLYKLVRNIPSPKNEKVELLKTEGEKIKEGDDNDKGDNTQKTDEEDVEETVDNDDDNLMDDQLGEEGGDDDDGGNDDDGGIDDDGGDNGSYEVIDAENELEEEEDLDDDDNSYNNKKVN